MIEIFSTQESEKWDEIVCSMEQHDVYYLSGYVKAFERHGDGKAQLIYMHNEQGRAIQVVMKRDIAKHVMFCNDLQPEQYYDMVTPYGYGGILMEGENTEELLKEYEAFCMSENIVCEFVRFHPMLCNSDTLTDYYKVIPLGDTVFMDTTSEDIIWQNISSKNRNMIRKAQKSGIEIGYGREEWMLDTFMDIYNQTMVRDEAEEYYFFKRDFYESIFHDLADRALWFYAKLDGKVIAMSIFLFANGRMHYHLSGSLKEYRNLAPSNLLLYEAAMWANKHGLNSLHLGGGVGSAHDSLYSFKKAFNRGEDTHFAIGQKMYLPDVYDRLVEIRTKRDENFNTETRFFPKYRG